MGRAPAHAAHFSVGLDGTIWQSRDTRFRSAANLEGNHRVVAIENEDHGPTRPIPPLTDAQVAANGRILRWAHDTHGVPLQLCPDSKPSSRGLAYHRQGIDGNFGGYRYGGRVAGGEKWSRSFGKLCPTDVRISQVPAILAAARSDTQGKDWLDMASKADVIQACREAVRAELTVHEPPGTTTRTALRHLVEMGADDAAVGLRQWVKDMTQEEANGVKAFLTAVINDAAKKA